MRLSAFWLYEKVKTTGQAPSPDVVATLYKDLDAESQRHIFYEIVEHLQNADRVIEFPGQVEMLH